MKRTEITGRITNVVRRGTSQNGNPSYDVTIDDAATYRTMTDGSIGYAAANYAPDSKPRENDNTLIFEGKRIVNIIGPDRWSERYGK